MFVRLALKVLKKNDAYFVDVTQLYPLTLRPGRLYRQEACRRTKTFLATFRESNQDSSLVHPVV